MQATRLVFMSWKVTVQEHRADVTQRLTEASPPHLRHSAFVDHFLPLSVLNRLRCRMHYCNSIVTLVFLQRGRIACNAERCNTYSNSVCLSVRPSVCLSVTRWYPIQTNEHRITRSSLWGSKNTSFLIPTMVGGRRPLPPKICAQSDLPTSEMSRLRPISAYNISTVRASEKSSTITNRKSTTCFPKSYRWSPYVTLKSPKVWLKKYIFHFCE